MHYAIFSARYQPLTGGVETFTRNLAHALVRAGHSVVVITTQIDSSPTVEVQDDDVVVVRVPGVGLLGGRLPLVVRGARTSQLLDQLAGIPFDRVLVNNRFYPLSEIGLQFAAAIGAPAVMLDHGSAHLSYGLPGLDDAIQRYEHAVTEHVKNIAAENTEDELKASRGAHAKTSADASEGGTHPNFPTFAGISNKSAKWLKHFGIETNIVIPNAIDVAAFRANASDRNFRAELGAGPNTRIVAFVGRIAPEKGADVLCEAAAAFAHDDVIFALAGDGQLRATLQKTAPANVRFLGMLPAPDISALLRDSFAFCLPTVSEGFCTSLLEAAAWGVPACIPDVGGTAEIIPDETYGQVIPARTAETVAQGLRTLLNMTDQEHEEMTNRLRAHVETHCSWAQTVSALDKAFD